MQDARAHGDGGVGYYEMAGRKQKLAGINDARMLPGYFDYVGADGNRMLSCGFDKIIAPSVVIFSRVVPREE